MNEKKEREQAAREKARSEEAGGESAGVDGAGKPSNKKLLVIAAAIVVVAAAAVVVSLMLDPGAMTGLNGADRSAPTARDLLEASFAEYDYGAVPDEAPKAITMRFRAREESWATVLADGDTVLFRSLRPWREYFVEADYRIVSSIAHPRLVDVQINGKDIDLRDPVSGRISRIEVNQANLNEFLARGPMPRSPAQPTSRPVTPEPRESTSQTLPAEPEQPDAASDTPSVDTEERQANTDTPVPSLDTATEPDTGQGGPDE
jgi:hypothetical protein